MEFFVLWFRGSVFEVQRRCYVWRDTELRCHIGLPVIGIDTPADVESPGCLSVDENRDRAEARHPGTPGHRHGRRTRAVRTISREKIEVDVIERT